MKLRNILLIPIVGLVGLVGITSIPTKPEEVQGFPALYHDGVNLTFSPSYDERHELTATVSKDRRVDLREKAKEALASGNEKYIENVSREMIYLDGYIYDNMNIDLHKLRLRNFIQQNTDELLVKKYSEQ